MSARGAGGTHRSHRRQKHPSKWRRIRIEDHRDRFDARRDLLQQFHPFRPHAGLFDPESGDHPARLRQAADEALCHRIGHRNEHDGNGVGRPPGGDQGRSAVGQHEVDAQIDQFFGLRLRANGIARRPAKFDLDVARRRPMQLLQALLQRRSLFLSLGIAGRAAHQRADPAPALRLLRPRRERPRRRAAEKRDERATIHSITSSARASSVGGMSRPNALLVWRLMTNSNLLDCMTGRSAGLAPLRILPMYTPTWRYASVTLAP
jgi:hypothetical protein